MIYSHEVEEMCTVTQGVHHGAAPIPEEAKWVKSKEVKDVSGLAHGIGRYAPRQGACRLALDVKEGIIQEALVETIGCSGMTHPAAMAAKILPDRTVLGTLNTDLVCNAINTAIRELFLQIVCGRARNAFSKDGLPVGVDLEDLGEGLRSQVGTMCGALKEGPRCLETTEDYVTGIALDADDQIIGYQFINLGKMTDFIKKGDDPNTAWKRAQGQYDHIASAAEIIDPRKEWWRPNRKNKKMALFESYERRIDKINSVLNSYGTASIKEAEKIMEGAGPDIYNQVKKIQPICLENACWAYIVGAAIAIKKDCKRVTDATATIGEGPQLLCIPGSVADQREIGLGHGNLNKALLEEETDCFYFLAGHESSTAVEGAIGTAEKVNGVRREPLRVILNSSRKDAAQIISRTNGFTYVETEMDYYAGEVKGLWRKSYSEGLHAKVSYYGTDDVTEGVAIMWKEGIDISITGSSTNPTRFQHPIAGTYKKECVEKGKRYFSAASSGGTSRTLHPDSMTAGPTSYDMTDIIERVHSDARSTGSSSVLAHAEMTGLIGTGNSPVAGVTVAIAVSIEEAVKAEKF